MKKKTQVKRTCQVNRSGVTLVEVLIATALFATGMAALMQQMHSGSKAAIRGELEILASRRCESIMALLKSDSQANPNSLSKSFNDDQNWAVQIESKRRDESVMQLTVIVVSRSDPVNGRFELTRLVPARSSRRVSQTLASSSRDSQ